MQSNNTTATITRLELTHGLNAAQVGDRLRDASDQLGINKRVLAFYLLDMEERRLHLVSGHQSTVHVAEAQLDMEARRTRELVQVGRSLQSLTLVDDAFRTGEISWARVLLLLPVVQRETQQGWLDLAKTVTCRDLRTEVHGCRTGDLPGEGTDYGLIHLKVNFEARLGDIDRDWVEQARMRLSKSTERPLTDTELLVEMCRLIVDGERSPRVEEPPPAADRNNEEVPDETRQEVLRRDRHRCRNCACHLDVEVHHIQFRRHGGSNDSHNLVTLCGTCHAAVHRRLLRIAGDPNHELRFTSANGDPIHRSGQPPAPLLN